MKNLSFLDKILYLANTLFATFLLLSFLLPYISPVIIPVFAILSLFVPVLLIMNFVFTIYQLKNHQNLNSFLWGTMCTMARQFVMVFMSQCLLLKNVPLRN